MDKPTDLHCIYFSAKLTTKKYVDCIAESMNTTNTSFHDVTSASNINDIEIPASSLAIFAAPVYAGRIPAVAAERFAHFKGHDTPAIIFCTYGNRAFDDALIELKDLVTGNGFKVISAAAFVACHSIFPNVAEGRPFANDLKDAADFASKSLQLLKSANSIANMADIKLPGNHHANQAENTCFFVPKLNKSKCDHCGTCVRLCPTKAIDADSLKIDASKCISCGHCIAVCPKHAKKFGGLKYWIAKQIFTKKIGATICRTDTFYAE